MIDIKRNNKQRVAEMAVSKEFGDEEEGSITVEDDDNDRTRKTSEAVASAARTPDPFLDSFSSIGLLINTAEPDNNRRDRTDNKANSSVTFGDDVLDISGRSSSFFHSGRMSSGSFDVSSNYGDDADGSNIKRPMAREQLLLRRIIYGLLAVAGILNILSGINFYATACSFANLAVIGAIGIVFARHNSRMKRREKKLLQSVTRSEAIVNSLFPEIVRDRILEEGDMEGARAQFARYSTILPPTANGTLLPDTIETSDDLVVENDTTGHSNNESYNSISSKNMDDPTLNNSREKFMPPAITPRSSFSGPPKRRKSLASVESDTNTNITDIYGDSVEEPHQHHKSSSTRNNLTSSAHSPKGSSSKPIADYFPSATIMFADIVGFTSWASVRDPVQVFKLLETVYGRFDRIAKKKGVFKVETIGDCYVAATGLPNPMNDHAVAMASFARRCLESMLETVADLEQSLGPGTSDLGMRIGIHSGSVIGGVLRGAKSRYQLFGDTMNTASRIESTSAKNKIQLSEQTAELIMEAGKKPWVELRRERIFAKGKGQLRTYWLSTEGPKNLSAKEELALPALLKMMAKADIDPGFIKKKKLVDPSERRQRLVDYHTNVLKRLLNKLKAMRYSRCDEGFDAYVEKVEKSLETGEDATKTFAEEAKEGILFPTSAKVAGIESSLTGDADAYSVDDSITDQLRELISRVSTWYRDDLPFHTFEHASHTVLSITKLLAAIDTTNTTTDSALNKTKSMITHPLTQFVLIFAALVNDAGDKDLGDSRLVAAEKSTRRAWSLFLEPSFCDLRRSICRSRNDFEFFRRLLGKSILVVTEARDSIMDRNDGVRNGTPPLTRKSSYKEAQEASNKALVIVEKLLRVSDVSYALQHFLVFRKWNKLLFLEAYGTYKSEAKSDESANGDPSTSWYEKELECFDHRISLVRALRDSGVCNKLSLVYLNAAVANRREWEENGKPIVEEYLSNS